MSLRRGSLVTVLKTVLNYGNTGIGTELKPYVIGKRFKIVSEVLPQGCCEIELLQNIEPKNRELRKGSLFIVKQEFIEPILLKKLTLKELSI